jgi:hypothetical protein
MNRPLSASQSIGSLSELDILGLYGASPTQPEKTLMLAILLDAVECFHKYAAHEANALFKDTVKWIFEDDHEWLFSFINICEAVEIDAQYLRKGLSQFKQQTTLEVPSDLIKRFDENYRGRLKTNPKIKGLPKRNPLARSN